MIVLGLLLPLIGALILAAFSYHLDRKWAGIIGCLSIFLAFLCFSTETARFTTPETLKLFSWIPVAGIDADFVLYIDPLALFMTLVVTGVGFLIHVYANGYMDHDRDFARFFACMNFFVFSMLLLVLAGHLLVLFVGWEGVGLASYLLIGFWYNRNTAAEAATKAFVINRIGDFGFLLGLLLIFYSFGTGAYQELFQKVSSFAADSPLLIAITILLFIGAIGKSAQLPLHTWLPDAMEGPTPVSALIHAATMVTAGVYLVVRLHPIFLLAPSVLHTVGVIGGATALFAALCALGQTDLKKVLAYSTVSQLGYMFLACGAGAFYSALFHLMSHAFVKALLFLSAGNVVHMMHGETEMDKMGGLYRIFTKTHWLFLLGALALSGVPPLTAFFSKDLILEHEALAGFHTLFYIGLATAFLTAVYLTRAYCLAFLGPKTNPAEITEAPPVMLIPTAILGLLTIGGGFIGMTFDHHSVLDYFLSHGEGYLAESITGPALLHETDTWFSIAIALSGVIGTWIFFHYLPNDLRKPIPLFKNSFYINELYSACIVQPVRKLAELITGVLEPDFIDGIVRWFVNATQWLARGLQKVQTGQIRSYAAWMVLGMVFLIAYLVF